MNILIFFRFTLELTRTLITSLVSAPWQFLKLIVARCKEIANHKRLEGQPLPFLPLSRDILRKPDPLIYSQTYLHSLGLAVTWNNPDIKFSKNGIPVDAYYLKPDTDYEMAITVHNGSNEAPALGLKIRASYRNWGIGGALSTIGERTSDLSVRGVSGEPATINITWHTPTTPEKYCIVVDLAHFDDLNPLNNRGQENTAVHRTGSNPGEEMRIAIPLRHHLPGRRTLQLEMTGYALPETPLYPPLPPGAAERFEKAAARAQKQPSLLSTIAVTKTAGEVTLDNWAAYRVVHPSRPGWPTGLRQYGEEWLSRIAAANAPSAHPANTAWRPALSATEVTLDPDEETTVEFRIVLPDDAQPGERQRFQVNAFDKLTGLIGGVELIVEVR